jgi:uncharacterized membrane protein YheB (UPF0754 family)
MNALFGWIIPPCAGALIGYVTNVVAVRMLFRPLGEKRVFGIRLPFTPGVLPRQRHKLADSIGAMVKRELLTPEILRARIGRETVREKLKDAVARCTEKRLSAPAGEDAERFLLSVLHHLFRSSFFDELLDRFKGLLGRSVRDLAGGEKTRRAAEKLDLSIRSLLTRLLPRVPELLFPLVEDRFPRFCSDLLNEPGIRRELEIRGRFFLDRAILKLNVMQRFFLSAGQYDRTLRERMPEIIDDLADQLDEFLHHGEKRRFFFDLVRKGMEELCSDEETAGRAAELAIPRIRRCLERPLGEIIGALRGASLTEPELVEYVRGRAPALEDALGAAVKRFLAENQDRSLGDLLGIGEEKKKELDAFLAEGILDLADEQIPALLSALDVQTLVSERINSLDMIRVERIILDVMADQLKWINLFGAVLGGLIGLFQVLFVRLI